LLDPDDPVDDVEAGEVPVDALDGLDEFDEQAARPRPATRARAAAVPPVDAALIFLL
jgi:hypothetical protein